MDGRLQRWNRSADTLPHRTLYLHHHQASILSSLLPNAGRPIAQIQPGPLPAKADVPTSSLSSSLKKAGHSLWPQPAECLFSSHLPQVHGWDVLLYTGVNIPQDLRNRTSFLLKTRHQAKIQSSRESDAYFTCCVYYYELYCCCFTLIMTVSYQGISV